MKKLLFISILLIFELSTYAQFTQSQYPSRYDAAFIKQDSSKDLFNPDHISGRNQQTFVSSTFDSVWADRFQTVLDSIVQKVGVKGASFAVYVPGYGTWTGVTGISSESEPITAEMRFGVMSNTKTFIAVVLTKLQEEGILSLDDPLSDWLPEYENVDPTATIRQLLLHQTGVYDFLNDGVNLWANPTWADTSRFWTTDEVLATIGEPHFQPGNAFRYSNTGFTLAALVIEAATGKSWVQKLHDIIFDPLDMDSTFVGAFESRNGPVANEYYKERNNLEIPNSPITATYSIVHAAGAILSTPQEMVGWYRALFNGEILSEAALNEVLDIEHTAAYGLGIEEFELIPDQFIFTHSGAGPGYISRTGIDKKSSAVFSFSANSRVVQGSVVSLDRMVRPLLKVLHNEYPKKENDAGITEISSPKEIGCNVVLNPKVTLMNFGSLPLTSVELNYSIDEAEPMVFHWTGELNTGETEVVNLPEITTTDGKHLFSCYTSNPNGGDEGYNRNDRSESNFIVNSMPSEINIISESFDSDVFPPEGWTMSSSSIHQWDQTSLARYTGSGSAVNSSYWDPNRGAFYDLNLPKISASEGVPLKLDFTYAYNMRSNYRRDTLQIFTSDDCGSSWQMVFEKGGNELRTKFGNSSLEYYPRTADEWRYVSIPLEDFAGDILIKFRMISDNSNNFFMDDVNVSMFTSAESLSSTKEIKVFPNPVSNSFRISGLPENSEFQLGTLSGQVLLKGVADKEITTISINHLPKGVYILRTTLGTEKIVKL